MPVALNKSMRLAMEDTLHDLNKVLKEMETGTFELQARHSREADVRRQSSDRATPWGNPCRMFGC